MKTFSVLILEDQQDNIDLLKIYIQQYCKNISTIYTAKTIEAAIDLYIEHYPDILLLDIELGSKTTSFSFLERIPELTSAIIFTTSHSEYAIRALNTTDAVAYLKKPIVPVDFVSAINKAIAHLQTQKNIANTDTKENQNNFIAISSTEKIDIINPKDIIYLEADKRYTIFHLKNDETKVSSRNLGEYEHLLDPNLFFRIHKSYLVNLNKVVSIYKSAGYYCILNDNTSLPLARRKHTQLRQFLNLT